MKKIQINEFKVNAQQMQVINQIAEEVKKSFIGWIAESMEEMPEEKFGCMVHFNKAQYDALMSIVSNL